MESDPTKLPLSVRDACLKAMRLLQNTGTASAKPAAAAAVKEHNAAVKVVFDSLHRWTKEAHNNNNKDSSNISQQQLSPGTIVALTLIYTRLIDAYGQRKKATPTLGTSASGATESDKKKEAEKKKEEQKKKSSEAAATKKKTGSSSKSSSSTNKAASSSAAPAASAKPVLPSKLDLSPKVSDAVREMANDLHQVHAILGRMAAFNGSVVVPAITATSSTTAANNHGTRSRSAKGGDSSSSSALAKKGSASNIWQDWNVVDVCILARDKMQSATAVHNLARTVPALRNLSETAVRVFVTFSSMVLDWMAAKVVRSVESYRDFLFLWQHYASLSNSNNNIGSGSIIPRPRPRLHVGYDSDDNHEDTVKTVADVATRAKKVKADLQLAAHWEPVPPGGGTSNKSGVGGCFGGQPRTNNKRPKNTSSISESKKMSESNNDNAATTTITTITTTATTTATTATTTTTTSTTTNTVPQETTTAFRVKTVAWTLAVDRSMHEQQNHPEQRVPSRRQRLVASCASLALVVGLACLSQAQSDQTTTSPNVDGSTASAEQPETKRLKNNDGQAVASTSAEEKKNRIMTPEMMDDFLQRLITAANQEAAFTRWACLGDRWKIAYDVKSQEVVDDLLVIAKGLWNRLTFEKKNSPHLTSMPESVVQASKTAMDAKDPTSTIYNKMPSWLMSLNKAVDGKPLVLSWHLPWLVALVHDTRLRAARQRKVRVEAAAFFRENCLAKEVNMRAWCTVISNRPVTGIDPGMVVGPPVTSLTTAASGTTAAARKEKKDLADHKKDNSVGVVAVAAEPTGTIAQAAARVEEQVSALAKGGNNSNTNVSNAVQSMRRSVTPSVITEAMEMNEWAVSLLYMETVRPSSKLVEYLKASSRDKGAKGWQNIVLPTVNKALLLLVQESLTEKATRKAPVSLNKNNDPGLVETHGDLTHDKALCKALVAVYYHALESILYSESKRLGKESHPSIVMNNAFHRALLACCCSCILKAIGATHRLRPSPNIQTIQIYNILHICESNPMDFLKVSGSFLTGMTLETAQVESPLLVLPRFLQKDFRRTEQSVLDSLLWARDPKFEEPFPDKLEDLAERTNKAKNGTPTAGGGDPDPICWWPVPELAPTMPEEMLDYGQPELKRYPTPQDSHYADFKTVSSLIRRVLGHAYQRIENLCQALDVPLQTALVTHVWVAFRYLLRNRIDLFFDRHVDHWILTSIYGVARKMKYNDITFASIIDAYVATRAPEMGDVTCQRIVRHIKINLADNEPSQFGNVIVLYNKIFVPVMKDHLLRSKSLKNAAERLVALDNEDDKKGSSEPTTVNVKVQSSEALLREKQSKVDGAPQFVLRFGDPSSKPAQDANDVIGDDSADIIV